MSSTVTDEQERKGLATHVGGNPNQAPMQIVGVQAFAEDKQCPTDPIHKEPRVGGPNNPASLAHEPCRHDTPLLPWELNR